jgi:hypothetical protein
MIRFAIRDVLWPTVVVAVAAAWYCDRVCQRVELKRQPRVMGQLIQSSKTEAARARESEAAMRQRLTAWNVLPASLRPLDRSKIYVGPSAVDGSLKKTWYDSASRRWVTEPFDALECH